MLPSSTAKNVSSPTNLCVSLMKGNRKDSQALRGNKKTKTEYE
jgi:hypothetical protein